MKIYDLVKQILEASELARNNDKFLMWMIWDKEGVLLGNTLTAEGFKRGTSPESITRARRKVQELHPELQAAGGVWERRQAIRRQKGTHIFREQTTLI